MPLIRMSSRYRKIMFPIELQFLFDYSEWFTGYFTLYSPIEYIIRYLRYIIRKFIGRYYLLYLRERCFVI